MYNIILIWRDESREPMKGRVQSNWFTGNFCVMVAEDGHTLAIPSDLIQTVELRGLTEEEEKQGYRPETTFREGDKSPWFGGMGPPKT